MRLYSPGAAGWTREKNFTTRLDIVRGVDICDEREFFCPLLRYAGKSRLNTSTAKRKGLHLPSDNILA